MADENKEIIDDLEGEFGTGFEDIAAKPFQTSFPRGTYDFLSTNVYLGRSAASNRKQMVMTCKIEVASTGEEFVGKVYTKTWGLKDEQNMEWLKRDMIALNIEPPKNPKDLIRVMNELTDIRFRGQLVPNKEDPDQYPPNLFLNRGAKLEGAASGGSAKAETF